MIPKSQEVCTRSSFFCLVCVLKHLHIADIRSQLLV